jgi:hypothetical protein
MAGRSSRALLEIADRYARKHYDELIALVWQGYQQHGRGVVLLNLEERPGAWTEARFYPWDAIAHLPGVKADRGLRTLVTTCDPKEMMVIIVPFKESPLVLVIPTSLNPPATLH